MPPNVHSSKTKYPKIPFTPVAVVTILFKSQEQDVSGEPTIWKSKFVNKVNCLVIYMYSRNE